MAFSPMVGGWSRQEMKLQVQQPHSRGAGEKEQMTRLHSLPGRSRYATTTDDSQDHRSAMDLVVVTLKSNVLSFTMSTIHFVLIIKVAAFKFWSLFITVLPSVFKRAARKRREEVRGAEEVHEDENTATELPVDQVSLSTLSTAWCDHVIKC